MAAKLIEEWGTLENLLDHAAEVTGKRAREGLVEHPDLARLSKELSRLRDDVDLGVSLDALAFTQPDVEALRALYERLGFSRLIENLNSSSEDGVTQTSADPESTAGVNLEVIRDLNRLGEVASELEKADCLVIWAVEGEGSVVDAPLLGVAISSDVADKGIYLPIAKAISE